MSRDPNPHEPNRFGLWPDPKAAKIFALGAVLLVATSIVISSFAWVFQLDFSLLGPIAGGLVGTAMVFGLSSAALRPSRRRR